MLEADHKWLPDMCFWPLCEVTSHNVKVKVTQSCPTLCDPMAPLSMGILQARILEWVAFPFSRGSSQPRDRTQVSHIANGFFTSWATGKPKNTGVGSLSLLQGSFLTQELGSPALQVDSLPVELPGKPTMEYYPALKVKEILHTSQHGWTLRTLC